MQWTRASTPPTEHGDYFVLCEDLQSKFTVLEFNANGWADGDPDWEDVTHWAALPTAEYWAEIEAAMGIP